MNNNSNNKMAIVSKTAPVPAKETTDTEVKNEESIVNDDTEESVAANEDIFDALCAEYKLKCKNNRIPHICEHIKQIVERGSEDSEDDAVIERIKERAEFYSKRENKHKEHMKKRKEIVKDHQPVKRKSLEERLANFTAEDKQKRMNSIEKRRLRDKERRAEDKFFKNIYEIYIKEN